VLIGKCFFLNASMFVDEQRKRRPLLDGEVPGLFGKFMWGVVFTATAVFSCSFGPFEGQA